MFITKNTLTTTASPESIWTLWQDVANWNKWDSGVHSSSIDGPFQTGTSGILKPQKGPRVSITLKEVIPHQAFTVESKLPLARLRVLHTLQVVDQKTIVTHQIDISGPLAFLFAYLIGRPMKKTLPHEMEMMVRCAEQR